MIYTVENEFLRARIKSNGAELCSLTDKNSRYEYLWQGNPKIWYGQSPVLFPIVGRLLNDKYRYNGKEYMLEKHGFARKSAFELQKAEGNTAEFLLQESRETLAVYPFHFDLFVKFELIGRSLKATHTVVNKNDGDMYFSLGGHPGFNCAIGDYLEFDEVETLSTETIDEDALRLPEKTPVLNGEKKIIITKDIFNNDALILSGIKSKAVTLKSDNNPHTVRFTFGDVPYLGIWAKPGAPYVCIEPWYGVNDNRDEKDDISKKEGIIRLDKGGSFELVYTAEVN
jgi:galactose mutarotase-like enzyme